MSSSANLIVIAFLILVIVWLFVRRSEARGRVFLAFAGVLYVAAMAATFWIFGSSEKVKLIGSPVLETAAMGLVIFSTR
jgi:drug/metabolite transporter superfamily protein YnfA